VLASEGVFIYRTWSMYNRNRTILYVLLLAGAVAGIGDAVSPFFMGLNSIVAPDGHCQWNLSTVRDGPLRGRRGLLRNNLLTGDVLLDHLSSKPKLRSLSFLLINALIVPNDV
jgi:hypothetical protein